MLLSRLFSTITRDRRDLRLVLVMYRSEGTVGMPGWLGQGIMCRN